MQPDVYRRVTELCEKIRGEHDNAKFAQMVEELNRLLDTPDDIPRRPPRNGSKPVSRA